MGDEVNTNANYTFTEEQFKKLMSAVNRRETIAHCGISYDGVPNAEKVETFLKQLNVYKNIEKYTDEYMLFAMPLLLKDDASTWWLKQKDNLKTWEEFESKLRKDFSPKPAHEIYRLLYSVKQEVGQSHERFILSKMKLFKQLDQPPSEKQQLDMIYGLLFAHIQELVPRDWVTTFGELLVAVKCVDKITQRNAEGLGDYFFN